jgi:glucose-1-phosphate cytidylyltransferase
MIEIGGKPILWHIMKIYSSHGINEFIICCGYKGYMIKEYFANYFLHMSNVTFDMETNHMQIHEKYADPWKVTLVDTGEKTMTGGRIKRIHPYLGNEDFCVTYGDGLSDVNITELVKFHSSHGKKASITAVQPAGRFGALIINGTNVSSFNEKPNGDGSFINGGFFVLNPSVLDLISGDHIVLEHSPLEVLAEQGQLEAYHHKGFWQPMDTMRDKLQLEELWASKMAPWKAW